MAQVRRLNEYREEKEDPFALEETTLSSNMPKRGYQKTIDYLTDLGLEFRIQSEYHIKIGWVNYYPTKGTINLDGASKFKGKGLEFLKRVLIRERILTR